MQVEYNVLCYMQLNDIDITRLAKETLMNKERLDVAKKQEWTAEEFLRICSWLGVDPWLFWKEDEERINQ